MKRLLRLVRIRSPRLGLLSDVAMVGTAALRVARRSSDTASTKRRPLELLLVAGAALRILRRIRQVRRDRRAARATA